jgi:hypothetical protein
MGDYICCSNLALLKIGMKWIHTAANPGMAKIATRKEGEPKLDYLKEFSTKSLMNLGKITKMKYAM